LHKNNLRNSNDFGCCSAGYFCFCSPATEVSAEITAAEPTEVTAAEAAETTVLASEGRGVALSAEVAANEASDVSEVSEATIVEDVSGHLEFGSRLLATGELVLSSLRGVSHSTEGAESEAVAKFLDLGQAGISLELAEFFKFAIDLNFSIHFEVSVDLSLTFEFLLTANLDVNTDLSLLSVLDLTAVLKLGSNLEFHLAFLSPSVTEAIELTSIVAEGAISEVASEFGAGALATEDGTVV